jgi:hypothetical protein
MDDKPAKQRLLTLDSLDGRSKSKQKAVALRDQLAAERGNELDALRAKSVETYAILSSMVEDQLSRYLAGEEVDRTELVSLLNSRKREAEQIGEIPAKGNNFPKGGPEAIEWLRSFSPGFTEDDVNL